MKTLLFAAGLVGLTAVQAAQAITIDAAVGGGALEGAGIRYLNFNGPVLGDSGVNVILEGEASAVTGFGNYYAPPFVSGDNHKNFNTPFVEGLNQSQYLQSSHAAIGLTPTNPIGSSITFDFVEQQNYFGLLWGSMDPFNNISFYLNGQEILVRSGDDVVPTAQGSQLKDGTYYVNFTDITFDEIVVWSDNYNFELDNVAYGRTATTSVPDGGMTVALLGLSMTGMALIRRSGK